MMLRTRLFLATAAVTLLPASIATASQRPVCPGPVAHNAARCHAHVVTTPDGTPKSSAGSPTGYGPLQFHGAYNLPSTTRTPQTIAIVDAYADPTVVSDFNSYNSHYGISCNGCLRVYNQTGNASPLPSSNSGWALEIALDVETAHQICQNCTIDLVEANSASTSDLNAAENTAVQLGATEISNSWGGNEYSSETSDATFHHPGIAITVSSGDNGYNQFGYPAASPDVVAVGGTTLKVTGSSATGYAYGGESAWSGSGSGCSSYEPAQPWQTSLSNWSLTGCGNNRGVADVAADADPNTGAAVYDTTRYQGHTGWFQVGGTSLSSPLVAGVFALAGGVSSGTTAASVIYGASGSGLRDVTSGSSGNCSTIMCRSSAGYDGPTGLGTPNGLTAF